jgi:hypothetical protein
MMEERERRVGENESLFRHVNERTKQVNETFAQLTDTFDVVCECGRIECLERITLSPEKYVEVRAEPTRFLVVPGHEIPETETVVEKGAGYVVVRKDPGLPARIARATAP